MRRVGFGLYKKDGSSEPPESGAAPRSRAGKFTRTSRKAGPRWSWPPKSRSKAAERIVRPTLLTG